MREMIKAIQKPSNEIKEVEAYDGLFKAIKDAGVAFVKNRNCSEELGLFLAGVATSSMMQDVKKGSLYTNITPEECLNAYLTLAFKDFAKGEKP